MLKGTRGVKVNHKFTLDPHLTKYTVIGGLFLDGRKLASSRFIQGGADLLSPALLAGSKKLITEQVGGRRQWACRYTKLASTGFCAPKVKRT